MRISFDNVPSQRAEQTTTSYHAAEAGRDRQSCGYKLDISDKVTDNTAYGFRGNRGNMGSRRRQGRSAEEVMQAAGNEDVSLYRNYMTVMSNSMSDEDFAKLQEEGYHPSDMEIEDAVTILDTIKAELLKAGVDITGYTDSIGRDVLTRITGSETYAGQLTEAFAREDIPVTEENVRQAMDAFTRGKELTEISDGALKYMVTNGMEPDIENLYLAQHAGAMDAERQGSGYFSEEMPGYYAQKASDTDFSGLQEQIDSVIAKAGYPVSEENRQDGIWLIEKGVALTEESFSLFKEVKEITLPAEDEELFASIAAAIAEGHPANQADLSVQKSIYRKAADCLTDYEERYREICLAQDTPETIKARRQLEEIRLHMTVEANIKLLKSGFSIDTAPMEEMIDALKQLEERSDTNVTQLSPAELCRETMEKTAEIPGLPAVTLGRLLSQSQPLTVDNVYETGKQMQESFRQAGEAYETMMTSPRADLGDSIRTAFRNVDALLENMGQELTDENRKAVRSLSYNRLDLTEENLLAVKGADKVVQRVVEKMTPTAVLSMIRDGVNPLNTSMEELDEYLADMDTYTEDSTKYSRFLYNMEQNHEITEEEKDSFIGVYRLLRQIEKSDGAAIGKLVGVQAEVNFANLLSAIRTGKVKGVDISVDERFGSLEEAVSHGISIETQIDTAFNRRILEEARSVNNAEDATIRLLKQLDCPVTVDNLLAAQEVRENGAGPFKKIRETENGQNSVSDDTETTLEEILAQTGFGEETAEGIASPYDSLQNMQDAYESLITQSENLAKALTFADGTGSLDVRALQLACKQLHIQGVRGSRNQEYDIPQMIDGELTAIHLKMVHDSQEKGTVSVSVDTTRYGHLSGDFSMEGDLVSGLFTGNGEEAAEVLQKAADSFSARLENSGLKAGRIQVVRGSMADDRVSSENTAETKDLYRVAGMVIGALKESL